MKQSGCKMAEIQKLLQQDIPADRQVLVENYTKLQQVAEHCEDNYVQAQDKAKALQETKAYTTQSLAGVVYQINTLAEKVLRLLDLQASEISKMESSINCISQRVEMHKEKVARREIGAFTAIKTTPKITKIIPPTNPIQRVKYTRKPIIYTILDDVGHGVKESSNNSRLGTLTRRNRQGSIPTCPTIPSQGTIGRRGISPAPVQPPVVSSALSSPVTSSPPADGPQVLSEPGRDRSSSRASDMVVPPPPPPPPPPPTPATCGTDGIGFPEPLAVNSLGLPPAPPPPPEVTSEIYLPPPPPLMSDAPSSANSASSCQHHLTWQGLRQGHSTAASASLRSRRSVNSPVRHLFASTTPLTSLLSSKISSATQILEFHFVQCNLIHLLECLTKAFIYLCHSLSLFPRTCPLPFIAICSTDPTDWLCRTLSGE
ncbi:abl interactor 1-like isoform X2 [Leucoraja erinacea]|uniref:abl interactor 1-like isoform X2 n=1 Tax=Leucoraja erinaceus TaxID=7782 RepID=UPI00245638F0|nr:abl interactor 1-like isoform X2 [Leucoraja erinacea]